MSYEIRLSCRLCEAEETFDEIESVQSSEWSEASPLGAVKSDNVRVHNAYCPGHSVEEL